MPASQALLFLPCAGGVEALLAQECGRILGVAARPLRGGVEVRGGLRQAMQLNLESRLAQRVLWLLADGPYRNEVDLYDLARRVDWTHWLTPEQTLRVDSTAHRSPLRSLNFANLRIKDAVCDALREATGVRPSVDTRHPTLSLVLHLTEDRAYLYADTSGEALFKRGWRDVSAKGGAKKGEAPLKENLAAAMLAAADWQGRAEDGPLFDPCCGAGTIAIEAAQIACGMAPGLQRRFAFEQLLPWRGELAAWRAMKADAQARVHDSAVPIFAGDVSFRMTDFATANARLAGVAQAIQLKPADALQRPPPAERGTLILNPPYGERIGAGGQGSGQRETFEGGGTPAEFFAQLATHWKRQYPGWTAWVLSPEMKLPSLMRLKESRRVPMWNGPIECRLFRFDMVAGSARN
jgi:putative N6-adenine-specific DNA methylase